MTRVSLDRSQRQSVIGCVLDNKTDCCFDQVLSVFFKKTVEARASKAKNIEPLMICGWAYFIQRHTWTQGYVKTLGRIDGGIEELTSSARFYDSVWHVWRGLDGEVSSTGNGIVGSYDLILVHGVPAVVREVFDESLIGVDPATYYKETIPRAPYRFHMVVLKRFFRTVLAGNIFRLHIPAVGWLFGRVIDDKASIGYGPGLFIIYIYDSVQRSPEPVPEQAMTIDRLLIPPFLSDGLCWRKGYFCNVGHRPTRPEDVLPQHCFQDADEPEVFVDGRDSLIERIPTAAHVGKWVYTSHGMVDHDLGKALGLPNLNPEQYTL